MTGASPTVRHNPAMDFAPTTPPHDRDQAIALARQAVLEQGLGGTQQWGSPWLQRSWQRCLAQGHHPHDPVVFAPVQPADLAQALERSQALREAARAVIGTLARAMADMRYFALLTDASGTVIDVHGSLDTADRRVRDIARVGVDLSESAVGTTAIGAALTERAPVWLHRGEHFFQGNGAYSCAGAPVFGARGDCVGMLDLTGVDVPERPALRHLVAQSACSIGNALVLTQPHRLLLRLNWPGQTLGSDGDGLVCLDAEGGIVSANPVGADMLGLPPGWLQVHVSEVFAAPWQTLFDLAQARNPVMETPLWSGLRVQVSASAAGSDLKSPAGTAAMPLKAVETALIRRTVNEAGGNVMEAAKRLGISRATIYRKLARRD